MRSKKNRALWKRHPPPPPWKIKWSIPYLEQQIKGNQASGEDKERKQEYVLKKLSDTIWVCSADSIKAFHHTIEAVIATLEDIQENEKKANFAAEAKGLLQNVKEFEFIPALEVYFLYLWLLMIC